MPDVTRLKIVRLASGGDGVAETAAGPTFIPYALPGEVWCGTPLRLCDTDGSYPRTPAACRHFMECGGCVAQHMPSGLYAEWKRDSVAAALARAGVAADVEPIVRLPPASRRRAGLTARRTGGRTALGYHAEGTHRLVDLAECAVLAPALADALPPLRNLAEIALRPERSLRISVLMLDHGLDVTMTAEAGDLVADAARRLTETARDTQITRLHLNGDLVLQKGPARLTIDSTAIDMPPGTFLQASALAEEEIARCVVAGVGKAKAVADVFCGIGTFALRLARRARVAAFDGDRAAITALTMAARSAIGRKPIRATCRDLFREPLSRRELDSFDAVVLDPPRAGAKDQCDVLARSNVARIVMVSCNPSTLARDLACLIRGGYVPGPVTPIDQFVWSNHVEVVVTLERKAARRDR
jgi:23S rRNA (uracil1939-C5)-methyltransferase